MKTSADGRLRHVDGRLPAVAFALFAMPALVATDAVAQTGRMIELLPPPPQARFVSCLDLADSDPAAAVEEARAWEIEGGGTLARECEAAALALDGRVRLAAGRYVGLGDEIGPRDPDYATGLYVEAARLWQQADEPLRAITALNAAIELIPDDAGIYLARARLRQATDDLWGALEDYWRASDLAPGRADILILRASAHRDAGLPDLAIADLTEALDRGGAVGEILLERAQLHLRVGNVGAARADLEMVLETEPDGISAEIAEAELARLDGLEGS